MKHLIKILSSFMVVFWCYSSIADDSARILVIHSYSQDYPWTKGQHEGFFDTLKEISPIIKTEYLDTKRVRFNPSYAENYAKFIKEKYKGFQPHAIYITDDNALKFGLRHIPELFPGTPLFFSGVNDYTQLSKLRPSRETGIFETKEIQPNLDLLTQLFQFEADSQIKMLIVGDNSKTYHAIKAKLEKKLEEKNHLNADYIASSRLDSILTGLRESEASIILLTTVGAIKDHKGNSLNLKTIIQSIAQFDDKIVISMEDGYLFDGVLGGYVTSAYSQGESAAVLMRSYLNGTSVASIPPITQSPNQYIFNDKVLETLGLSLPDNIAKVAKIINPRSSFYQRNEKIIRVVLAILSLSLVIMSFLYFLFISRTNKKLAQANTIISDQASHLESEVLERTKALSESRNQLKLALESANLGLWDWQPQRNKLSTNDIFLTMLGYSPDAFPQTLERWASLVHPDDLEPTMKILQPFIDGDDGVYQSEHRMLAADKKWHWILDVGRVIERDEQGKAERFTGVHIDITEQKLFQQQLLEAQVKAQLSNKAKSEFLANMSHEFRTPMHGIISFVKIGLNHPERLTQEKAIEYFGYIKTSADRLMALLNDLLDLAKLESGKMAMNYGQYSLETIVKSCIAEQQARLTELNIDISWHQDSISGDGEFDATRMSQVVTNYLSNAIKFTPKGQTIELLIANKTIDSVPALLFSMRDHGQGIPAGECELIFNKFEQGSDSTIGITRGTGLGLPICKQIIRAHSGKLWAENHPDGGAVFGFIIPIGQAEIE